MQRPKSRRSTRPQRLHGGLIGTVSEMLTSTTPCQQTAGALTGLADGTAAAGQARQIAELFAAHAARENDVLLPALLADHDVDLAALLAQMHRRAEEAARAAPPGDTTSRDPQSALVGLLLEARGRWPGPAGDLAAARRCGMGRTARGAAGSGGDADRGATRADTPGRQRARPGRQQPPVSGQRASAARQARSARQARPVSTYATCLRRSAMRRSSQPTGTSPRERVSCLSTTTTPSRCGTSSRPSTRASSPGTTCRPGRRPGGCASAAPPPEPYARPIPGPGGKLVAAYVEVAVRAGWHRVADQRGLLPRTRRRAGMHRRRGRPGSRSPRATAAKSPSASRPRSAARPCLWPDSPPRRWRSRSAAP